MISTNLKGELFQRKATLRFGGRQCDNTLCVTVRFDNGKWLNIWRKNVTPSTWTRWYNLVRKNRISSTTHSMNATIWTKLS